MVVASSRDDGPRALEGVSVGCSVSEVILTGERGGGGTPGKVVSTEGLRFWPDDGPGLVTRGCERFSPSSLVLVSGSGPWVVRTSVFSSSLPVADELLFRVASVRGLTSTGWSRGCRVTAVRWPRVSVGCEDPGVETLSGSC